MHSPLMKNVGPTFQSVKPRRPREMTDWKVGPTKKVGLTEKVCPTEKVGPTR